jgi:hypothetical protein
MTNHQMRSLTLEQLAIELPEARFGRGIIIDRSPNEVSRNATLAGLWEVAKRDCPDADRVARAEYAMRLQTAGLFALWSYAGHPC